MTMYSGNARAKRLVIVFCNNWRDTIFYTLVFAALLADIVFSLKIPLVLIVGLAEIREISRALSWSCSATRNYRYAFMSIFICECMLLVPHFMYAIFHHDAHPHTGNAVYIVFHMMIATLAVTKAGGVKETLAAYKATLFDYPRKIMPPPKVKKVELMKKLASIMGALLPEHGRPAHNFS
jgi:hypothetical protein